MITMLKERGLYAKEYHLTGNVDVEEARIAWTASKIGTPPKWEEDKDNYASLYAAYTIKLNNLRIVEFVHYLIERGMREEQVSIVIW